MTPHPVIFRFASVDAAVLFVAESALAAEPEESRVQSAVLEVVRALEPQALATTPWTLNVSRSSSRSASVAVASGERSGVALVPPLDENGQGLMVSVRF
jgi:hypothetical protein